MPDWDDIFSKRGRVFLRPHPDMESVKDLILDQCSSTPKVLDLGCGTGRHLLYFAKEGFEMYGIDGSPKGIELSKKWLSRRELNANLVCQKIEECTSQTMWATMQNQIISFLSDIKLDVLAKKELASQIK